MMTNGEKKIKMKGFVFLLLFLISPLVKLFGQDSLDLNQGIELVLEGKDAAAESVLSELLNKDNDLTTLQKGKAHYYLLFVYRDRNELPRALEQGKSALERFQLAENNFWLGKTNHALCMINLIAGDYDLALRQIQDATDYFAKAKDTGRMISAYARKGLVYHDIGEYETGIRSCQQADDLFRAFSEKEADLKATVWGIMAINYDDGGNSEKAIEIYLEILELSEDLSSEREIVRTYNNLGNSLRKLGRLAEAKKYIQLNLEANEAAGFAYGVATAKTNLGNIAYRQGRMEDAKELLDEAERIAYEINDVEKIQDVLQQQHLFYEQMGQNDISLNYLRKFHSVKDSLYGLDKQRQLRLLETRYETQKKEQQIAVQSARLSEQEAQLQTNRILLIASVLILLLVVFVALLNRSRIRKKQELSLQLQRVKSKEAEIRATISSLEKERTRYARDLHDGLGQMVSVLNRNLQNLEETTQLEEQKKMIHENEEILDEMYRELKRICFDLMPQTLLSSGLVAALKELAHRISQTKKLRVVTDFSGFEANLNQQQEISIYRISQEWLNNVLKYSDAQQLTLQLTNDEEELTLMIEDDGMGFLTSKLNNSDGNGWRNINSRVDLLSGSLHLESQPTVRGNVLMIDFPLLATKQ